MGNYSHLWANNRANISRVESYNGPVTYRYSNNVSSFWFVYNLHAQYVHNTDHRHSAFSKREFAFEIFFICE